MTRLTKGRAHVASVRAAVERSRNARLRRVKRRLITRLNGLYRHDRPGYRALVRLLRSVVAHETRRGR